MTHDKLVKHMQKHEGGEQSLYYIKYIMDNMETEVEKRLQELHEEKISIHDCLSTK